MSITITTWNVQNLRQGDPFFADKLNFLVGTLQALESDVVALQEILDLNALQELANRLGFHHFAAMPDGRENRVAFLTRNAPAAPPQQIDQWQLPQSVEVRDFNINETVEVVSQLPRPAFQITVAHKGAEIDIVNAHLKSKLLTFGGKFSTTNETLRAQTTYFAPERRSAEATTLQEHVASLLSAARKVIVLGDFNDGPEAATTQILYDPPGSQPQGPEDATHASGAFQQADVQDGQRLFNVTKLVPEDIQWSRRYNGENELLDYILVSDELMPRLNDLRQLLAMSILNQDTPNMIGPHPIEGGVAPDHAPVTATLV